MAMERCPYAYQGHPMKPRRCPTCGRRLLPPLPCAWCQARKVRAAQQARQQVSQPAPLEVKSDE